MAEPQCEKCGLFDGEHDDQCPVLTGYEQGSAQHLLKMLDEVADESHGYFEIPSSWAKVLRDHIRGLTHNTEA